MGAHWKKTGPSGRSCPFGSQCHCWPVDRAFLSRRELLLSAHSVKGAMPKSGFELVCLPHERGADDRGEEFEDTADGVIIVLSVVGSYYCILER